MKLTEFCQEIGEEVVEVVEAVEDIVGDICEEQLDEKSIMQVIAALLIGTASFTIRAEEQEKAEAVIQQLNLSKADLEWIREMNKKANEKILPTNDSAEELARKIKELYKIGGFSFKSRGLSMPLVKDKDEEVSVRIGKNPVQGLPNAGKGIGINYKKTF